MWHARDVGHQPINTIGRHHRGIEPGPSAERGQGCSFAGEVGRAGRKIGADGAGIGHRHAARQAPGRSRWVQTMQVIGIA
jgi:hypothetical protein